jgi:chitinase
VIDRYKFTWLDFDIEGKAIENEEANHRRNTVLVALQKKNPGLIISYTLSVDPTGLSRHARGLLTDAKAQGVLVHSANVMTMDYGARFSDGKKMSEVSIASAEKAHEQCQAIDSRIQIGLTSMIGQNDVKTEVFTLEDAQAFETWAVAQPWVCSVSFWSSNRDAGVPGRKQGNTGSGIPQSPWAFTKTFQAFAASKQP